MGNQFYFKTRQNLRWNEITLVSSQTTVSVNMLKGKIKLRLG